MSRSTGNFSWHLRTHRCMVVAQRLRPAPLRVGHQSVAVAHRLRPAPRRVGGSGATTAAEHRYVSVAVAQRLRPAPRRVGGRVATTGRSPIWTHHWPRNIDRSHKSFDGASHRGLILCSQQCFSLRKTPDECR